ncbi:hypothetical protein [Clostridium butyricum]|uniref:hypothetical protein n=2 Tax=Clostridium butyricum TaxID=1492 RepID=UPI00325B7CCD
MNNNINHIQAPDQIALANIYAFTDEESEVISNSNNKQRQKTNIKDVLVKDILREAHLFIDDRKEAHAIILVGAHKEILAVRGEDFSSWIIKKVWDTYGKTISTMAVKDIVNSIEAHAKFGGIQYKLNLRVAGDDKSIYYDLVNRNWEIVEIDASGWRINNNPLAFFKRYKTQNEQVRPVGGGDINSIFRYINVKEADKLLFLVYLISCFIPEIAHPIGVFYGEKGSAKTTASKVMKMIIDPSIMPTITFPKNNEELIQNLAHNWFCNFDNISNIGDTTSDTLCRAVTGEGYSKRGIYTNEDDVVFTYKRCVSLNGIDVIPKKDDLLDRSILFELDRIQDSNRKGEYKLLEELRLVMPEILGSIFDILSKAIRVYSDSSTIKLNRMADFTSWGYAIAEAIGGLGSEFLSRYNKNINKQNLEAINSNSFASAVVALLDSNQSWSGKASDLMVALETVAERERIHTDSSDFPTTSNMVSKKLKSIKSNLERLGIEFEIKRTNTNNIIHLRRSGS